MPQKPPASETQPLDGAFTLEPEERENGPSPPADPTWTGEPGPATTQPVAPAPGFGATSTTDPRLTVLPATASEKQDPKPRFQLLRKLGKGGMGEVEACQDLDIGRTVALKRLHPGIADRDGLLRFADEVRTIGQLEHPNITPVHDVGVDELGRLFFIMKHVDGEDLSSVVKRLQAGEAEAHERFGFEERVRIFRGVLEAVDFAHGRGVLHRDLKPANIMVGQHGEVLVIDWGLARPLEGSQQEERAGGSVGPRSSGRSVETRHGSVVGTPAYMSPEQVRGEALDERSDVYALCVIFYELLGLRHYLQGCDSTEELLQGVQELEPPMLRLPKHLAQPNVPMDLLWFLRRGLRKDKVERYPSVRAMLDRLDDRAMGRIPIQCPVTLTMRGGNEISRLASGHPLLAVGGYLAALLGFVLLAVILLG